MGGTGLGYKDTGLLWATPCVCCPTTNSRISDLVVMEEALLCKVLWGLMKHRGPVPLLVPAQPHSPLLLQQRAEDLKELFNEALNVVTAGTGHQEDELTQYRWYAAPFPAHPTHPVQSLWPEGEKQLFSWFPILFSNLGAGEGANEVREMPLLGLGRRFFHLGSGSQGLTCFL